MFIQLDGVRLFFDVEGTKLAPDDETMREKPTLVCLHGGPGLDHSVFRPALAPLAAHAQVIYLDQRGHGRSDRGALAEWSLAQWAEDVRDFCEALGIDRPIILGTSFGGYVAMVYAIKYPTHPSKLVLVSTSARGTGNTARLENMLRAFERRGGPAARDTLRRALVERTSEAYAAFTKVCGPLYSRRKADADALRRTLRNDDVLQYFERPDGEGVTFDLTDQLSAISCPTLILGGADDPITPPEEQQIILDRLRPGIGRMVRFEACGHGVVRDDAQVFLDAVGNFIGQPNDP